MVRMAYVTFLVTIMFVIFVFALARAWDYEHYYNTCVITQESTSPVCK